MKTLRLLSWLFIFSALTLYAQSECSYEWWVLTDQTPSTAPSCGIQPFPFQITFSYYFEVDDLGGSEVSSANTSVAGNGYCSGLGFICAYQGAPLPYVNWKTTYYDHTATYLNVATITNELPGGTAKMLYYGCAGPSFTTSSPLWLQGPVCNGGCPPGCQDNGGKCACCPIVLDAKGRGFKLTDIEHGVYFRIDPKGPRYAVSWTDPEAGNGWLVLPDEKGEVHDFTNFFSAITPQPKTADPNGYIALAVYDLPSEGGNNNGWIDPGDKIYSILRV